MLLWALLLAAQAAAPDIVVTGEKPRRELSAQIRAVTQDVDGRLPRFRNPVCPVVAGLPEAYGEAVVERVRARALEAGGKVAPRPCEADIFIVVTAEPRAALDRLRRDPRGYFSLLSNADVDRLVADGGPVWGFRTSVPRRADGGRVQPVAVWEMPGMTPQAKRAGRGAYKVDNARLSRLSEAVRRDADQAWLVVDAGALVGRSLGQIGDYAAMTTLAPIDTAKGGAMPFASILSLFETPPAEAEAGATAEDLAFLARLYGSRDGLSERQAARRLADSVRAAGDD
ncbi:hypothetical protein [Sphingomicrobium aestuariivivum]|uniref:hypothetical protein n=1 Tax=Sphingomicrobium aestuariivivum TaxID=1582356 RepID=UPI001FD64014|nr:hypothetical protein [Sphingomicrobium aestuariivivum]MCJ8190624.1 hypothetical protein [Sphingomicrobium aestuariivivum]